MRGVPSTCGMILSRKFGAASEASDVRQIGFAVLVAHRTGGDPEWPVIQGTDQRVDLGSQRRLRQFLRKAPELAATGDRPLVIEEHAVGVAALAAAERDGDHLPALGVVAESRSNPACG